MLEIKKKHPSQIDLEDLVNVQEKAFDWHYVENDGINLQKRFKGSSFYTAEVNNKVAGYLWYVKPEDSQYSETIATIDYSLNNYDYHKGKTLGTTGSDCQLKCFNLDACDQDLTILKPSEDHYLIEFAVDPDYQKQGIATSMLKKHESNYKRKRFIYTEKGSKMHNLLLKNDFKDIYRFVYFKNFKCMTLLGKTQNC